MSLRAMGKMGSLPMSGYAQSGDTNHTLEEFLDSLRILPGHLGKTDADAEAGAAVGNHAFGHDFIVLYPEGDFQASAGLKRHIHFDEAAALAEIAYPTPHRRLTGGPEFYRTGTLHTWAVTGGGG